MTSRTEAARCVRRAGVRVRRSRDAAVRAAASEEARSWALAARSARMGGVDQVRELREGGVFGGSRG